MSALCRVGVPALIAAGLLSAQGLMAVVEQRYHETPRPVVAPEPKRRVGMDPLALLRLLQSPVASDRAKGLEGLGLSGESHTIP
ncbi:MAG: hypothetical protein FJW31_19915 [Acidobacteria bacterium]|nr:hypothetical protein [Acidobacteriota bacterium]